MRATSRRSAERWGSMRRASGRRRDTRAYGPHGSGRRSRRADVRRSCSRAAAGESSRNVRTGLLFLIAAAFAFAGCQSREEKARAEFSARLKQQRQLTPEEMVRLYEEIGRTLGARNLLGKRGPVTRERDEREQAAVLGMLSIP